MTTLGLLTFFGMAVVTMDVLGGVIAATFLARGMRPLHLLAFVGAYAASVIAVTLALKPLLGTIGGWLAPVLGSAAWLAAIQVAVGCALLGFSALQRRNALHPRPPRTRETTDRLGGLAAGGALLSLTTFADPTFTVAVGLAMQSHSLTEEIALLTAWNVIYQLPLVTVTVASLLGAHRRVLGALARFFGPRRRALLLAFAVVLALLGLAAIIDGGIALATHGDSWLQSLLVLRESA